MTWTYHKNEERRSQYCPHCLSFTQGPYFQSQPENRDVFHICLSCAEELAATVDDLEYPVSPTLRERIKTALGLTGDDD